MNLAMKLALFNLMAANKHFSVKDRKVVNLFQICEERNN